MQTLYLHIGLHKTASTTIQRCLNHNQQIFKQVGYSIPQADRPLANWHNIAWGFLNRHRYAPRNGTLDDLIHEMNASGFSKFIVSSEEFDLLVPEQISLIRDKTAHMLVKIIVFLRRQDQWLQSAWATHVKRGLTQQDFHGWHKQRLEAEWRLHYYEFLQKWSDIFGRENIIVVPLETGFLKDRHVFIHFLEACDIHTSHDWAIIEARNISPS